MKFTIVSTFGPGGWDLYARRMVESMRQFWPDVELVMYYHDLTEDVPQFEGVTFRCLNDIPTFSTLKSRLGGGSDQFALKYCFKAIALADAVRPDLDWLAFIDADVEAMRPIEPTLTAELFDDNFDLTYLYRKSVQESEGSFIGFNLRTPSGASLLSDWYGMYASAEFLQYKRQYDNAVLDRIVAIHRAHGLTVKNLADGALGLDAFHQSPLGGYFIHYKGNHGKKDTIADPGLGVPSRYESLCEVLQHAIKSTGSAKIVEVGTWNGSRAIQMAEAAFATGATSVTYAGFDTFDDGNDRVLEGHTKPHASFDLVGKRLQNYRTLMARKGKTFNYMLTKGNTLTTLPELKDNLADFTFAYIDGGHSYETVASDYANLAHIPYVVFDDVVKAGHPDAPDGPRRAFEETQGQKCCLQTNDPYFINGQLTGEIALGIVARPGYPPYAAKTRLQVKPVDSVDKEEQFQHIDENSQRIKEWLAFAQAHDRSALLVSAGPTLPDYLDDIRAKQAAGAVVFAVKHAYPTLLAAGIRPDFTVVLDPRPVSGVSTHGKVRTTLFEGMGPDDKVLMATMTHPSVRLELEAKGARIIGWHAHTASTQHANLTAFQRGLVVGGGTCSATRMPMLAFTLGFRRLEFYGYDFFYPADTKPEQIKQQLMKVQVGEDQREFLTTGELVAAMQDLGQWNRWLVENRLTVTFHGNGAGTAIWNSTVKNYAQPAEYPY